MSMTQKQLEFAAQIVREMIQRLGLKAQVSAAEKEGDLVVKLETSEAGRLIGRQGRSIDSLEYLVNRILGHHEQDFPRAILDVAGDEKEGGGERRSAAASEKPSRQPPRKEKSVDHARKTKVEQLALDAAKEVKRWGAPKSIGPYNADDRRLIEAALQDDPEIIVETDPGAAADDKLKKLTLRLADGEQ